LFRTGCNKSFIAELVGTTRQAVQRWCSRACHRGSETFKDKPRKSKESKVTVEVEVSILALRNAFAWGTARIQQGLYKLPKFMLGKVPCCVQGIRLSRVAINSVLKKHGINGYKNEQKAWKFFRASAKDELWQIDLKGPFSVQGTEYWFIVCIDDYSRYLLLAEQLSHCPSTAEITATLESLGRKPKSLLSDNGGQFKEQWKFWCKRSGIEPLFAHPYYPQDKGKVERAIRNIAEEFVKLLRTFPEWLDGQIGDYREWYNESRFHRGIKGFPADLYTV
jgi:transposase InsO family protein